jgi:hypothetical protein
MAKLTAAALAEKWARRASSAQTDYEYGVKGVTASPMDAAVAKQAKLRAGIIAAIDSGKWASHTKAVSLQVWQSQTVAKSSHFVDGVRSAQPKMEAVANKLLPYMDTLAAKIKAMPDLTLSDSIARATAWITGMAGFDVTK